MPLPARAGPRDSETATSAHAHCAGPGVTGIDNRQLVIVISGERGSTARVRRHNQIRPTINGVRTHLDTEEVTGGEATADSDRRSNDHK